MTHTTTTETKEATEFGQRVTLHRACCSCGWRSCWHNLAATSAYLSADPVATSAERHLRLYAGWTKEVAR